MSFALARDRAASKRRDGCVIASLASSPQKQSGQIFIQPLGRDPAWVSRKELQVNKLAANAAGVVTSSQPSSSSSPWP
jgi:hypothetical protein